MLQHIKEKPQPHECDRILYTIHTKTYAELNEHLDAYIYDKQDRIWYMQTGQIF